jgi:GNAT superfamily N-acetyltransferase
VNVQPIPGLEHLPYAEVWFHAIDDTRWQEASNAAAALGKTGLEVWTTTRTPDVAEYLRVRDYQGARRYVISELDVPAAPDPAPPAFELATFAERPDLAGELFALAQVAYPDQPGREGTRVDESWHEWGLGNHPADAYFVALEDGRVLGYGYLERDGGEWRNGFLAVARDARGRGVAGAIKRAQIVWAKANGVPKLRTATERRLTTMLDLNRRLGYRALYEEIVLRGPAAT